MTLFDSPRRFLQKIYYVFKQFKKIFQLIIHYSMWKTWTFDMKHDYFATNWLKVDFFRISSDLQGFVCIITLDMRHFLPTLQVPSWKTCVLQVENGNFLM
jgi:hypothetical protein